MLATDIGTIATTTIDTTLGRLLLAGSTEGLIAAVFAPDQAAEAEHLARISRLTAAKTAVSSAEFHEAITQFEEFLTGQRREFTLPWDLRLATPFQQEVLTALGQVKYGQTSSYRELALQLDRPGAARAVGSALGANPLCVVLPCHRIVGTSGALSGYAGGLPAKRFLLDLEQASLVSR